MGERDRLSVEIDRGLVPSINADPECAPRLCPDCQAPLKTRTTEHCPVHAARHRKKLQPSENACHCGRRHRKPPPSWRAEAVILYQSGESYAQIARRVRASYNAVRYWVQHEGIPARSRVSAGKERWRRKKANAVRPKIDPRPCECGCNRLTTGIAYRTEEGKWVYPRFAPRCWKAHPRPGVSPSDWSRCPWRAWLEVVQERCKREGLSFTDVERMADVSTVISTSHRPRPKAILCIAKVLKIDAKLALELAGYEELSPARFKLMLQLRDGGTIQEVADQSGVPPWKLYGLAYRPTEATLQKDDLQALRSVLHLSSREVGEELRQSAAAKRRASNNRAEANRARAIDVDEADLRRALSGGGSYEKASAVLRVSATVVRDRAIALRLRPGLSRKEAHFQREKREKRERQLHGLETIRQFGPPVSGAKRRARCEELLEQATASLGGHPTLEDLCKETTRIDPNGKGVSKDKARLWWRARIRDQ